MKLKILKVAKAIGLFALARFLTRRHLRILCYHGIWDTPGFQYGDRLFMPPEKFDARMRWLHDSIYPVVSLDDAVTGLNNGSLPANAVTVTIDDGWQTTVRHMLPSLERLNLPATLYVTTWHVDRRLPVVVKAIDYIIEACERSVLDLSDLPLELADPIRLESAQQRQQATEQITVAINKHCAPDERTHVISAVAARANIATDPWLTSGQFHLMTRAEIKDAGQRGLDIQLHTHRHIHIGARVDELGEEIDENRQVLAAATGLPASHFTHFCYPGGTYHADAEAVLSMRGIRSATLVEQGLNAPGTNPLRLRRFLDGRSVSQIEFEAYLSGALELIEMVQNMFRKSR